MNRLSFLNSVIMSSRGGYEFSPQYKLILAKAQAEGFALPSMGWRIIHDTIIRGLITAGLWSNVFDRMYYWRNDADINFGRINWVDPSKPLLTFVGADPIQLQNIGWYLDTTVDRNYVYVDSHYVPSVDGVRYSLNDAGVYVNQVSGYPITGQIINTPDTDTHRIYFNFGNPDYFTLNRNAGMSGMNVTVAERNGFYAGTRPDSGNLFFHREGIHKRNTASPSEGRSSGSIALLGASSSPTYYPNSKFATSNPIEFIAWGANLSAANQIIIRDILAVAGAAVGGQASAGTGQVKFSGGNGGKGGATLANGSGAGGSSAGYSGDGFTGADGVNDAAYHITSVAPLGGGAPGYNALNNGNAAGVAGVIGSGGGGARRTSSTRNGGSGGQGYIRVSYSRIFQ